MPLIPDTPYIFHDITTKISEIGVNNMNTSSPQNDNNFESRITRLEVKLDNISTHISEIKEDIKSIKNDMKTDFRWLLATVFALGGLMAHGFHWF